MRVSPSGTFGCLPDPWRLFSATNRAPTLLTGRLTPAQPHPMSVLPLPRPGAMLSPTRHVPADKPPAHRIPPHPPASVPQVALVSWRFPTPLVPSTLGIPRQASPVIPFNAISGPTPKRRHTRRSAQADFRVRSAPAFPPIPGPHPPFRLPFDRSFGFVPGSPPVNP